MKKFIVYTFAIFFSSTIFAQKFSGGLFIGPTASWMGTDYKTVKTEGIKMGYNFGATLDYNITDNFALSTAVQFNNAGGTVVYTYGASGIKSAEGVVYDKMFENSKIKYNINYLAIPVGIKGKTNEIGYITYFLKAGVTPLVRLKALGTVTDSTGGEYKKVILKDQITPINFGWHIGGGIEYTLAGSTRLLVEILYTGGLIDVDRTDVFTNKSLAETTDPKVSLSDIHLKVGILF